MVLCIAITASSSVTCVQTTSNLPATCGVGRYLHKECPEKGNTSSTSTCCNCRLAEGGNPHPANYRDCRHAKEEMQKEKPQRTPGLQREGCSLPTSPLHACTSRRRSEVGQWNSSSLRHIRWQVRSRHNGTQSPCGLTPTATTDNTSVSLGP
jgi:hypothetical protein